MPKTAPIKSSTQKFIEIQEIRENIVLLEGARACIIMQVTATNFSLLSKEEQDSRMFAYASLLNSLSFPVEILIRSKRVQIESYLKLLDQEAERTTNTRLATEIRLYRDFIENLVKMTTVLDKQFYVAIPYSPLEAGIKGTTTAAQGAQQQRSQTASQPNASSNDFFSQAKTSLRGKAEAMLGQVERIGLHTHVLERDELIKLFYEIYNPDSGALQMSVDDATKPMLVSTNKIV